MIKDDAAKTAPRTVFETCEGLVLDASHDLNSIVNWLCVIGVLHTCLVAGPCVMLEGAAKELRGTIRTACGSYASLCR